MTATIKDKTVETTQENKLSFNYNHYETQVANFSVKKL